jgi:hypothetical protein
LSLENVAVTGNATTSALPGTGLDGGPGGGIVNAGAGVQGSGVLFLLDSTVSGNATGSGASGSGGTSAICATATQNTLGEPGGSGGPGGGIAERSGVVNIQDSTISSNTTGAGGQGGQGGAGDPGCFPAGAAGGSAGNGGAGAGVFNRGGTLIVGGSTFAANVTGRGGQGGAGGSSLPPVCTGGPGSSGGAGGSGAGIATGDPTGVVGGVTLTVLNSTIAFNRAGGCGLVGGSTNAPGPTGSLGIRGSGAGIFQFTGSATVTNATIAEPLQGIPTATLAISSIAVASGSFIEANTIIQGARCLGPISDGGFNLNFQAFFCPGRTANPGLEGLANNGGPTQTMALAGFSAAIDQGPAFPLICPATDQRGEPRPDNSETACDIGAFEVQDSPSLPSSVISGAGAGPRSVALGVHTPGTHGATITVALSKPRALVLLVRRIAGRRLITLGYARLGKHPGGRRASDNTARPAADTEDAAPLPSPVHARRP